MKQKGFGELWEEGDLVLLAGPGVAGVGDIGIVCGRARYPSGTPRDCYNVLFNDGYRMIHITKMREVKDGSTS